MSSLRSRPGHGLLRCPLCRGKLIAAAGALVCRDRHNFDLAREGYVNLLAGKRVRAGDGREQLRHRAAFLDAGHFAAVSATIATQIGRDSPSGPRHWRVLDAGSGTGHHLARLADALRGPVTGLGLDLAKDAARLAARRWPALAFAVADLWAEWPVHDAAVDLVASFFAPKNFPEAARVLRPGGWLAIVYPGPDHLAELRDAFGLLRALDDRTRRYTELIGRFVGSPASIRLYRRTIIDPGAIRDVILMGPNAHHIVPARLADVRRPVSVTFDIEILLAQKG